MEYTLSGLRHNIAVDLLDDEEYEPAIIDRAINRAQQEIFNRNELSFQEKIFSGTVPAGSTIFAYPKDMQLVQNHVISEPNGVEKNIESMYIPFREFTKTFPTPNKNAPSPITAWTSYGGNILTSAPTDKEYTLEIYYIKKPVLLLADYDVPEIPEEFAELLELGAYIRILKRNEDLDLAQPAMQDYADKLNDLVSRYGYRKTGPIKMKNTQRRVR